MERSERNILIGVVTAETTWIETRDSQLEFHYKRNKKEKYLRRKREKEKVENEKYAKERE